jgi:hypothetical protein
MDDRLLEDVGGGLFLFCCVMAGDVMILLDCGILEAVAAANALLVLPTMDLRLGAVFSKAAASADSVPGCGTTGVFSFLPLAL